MGHLLPPNTIVATQAWSMHRDPTIFPSPETFLPDRWLETADNAEQLTLMSQYMMPFGVGTRMCGGQNLAQIMIRVVLTSVVRNFNIVAPPETNEKSMDIRDAFVGSFSSLFILRWWLSIIAGHFPGCSGVQAEVYSTHSIADTDHLRVPTNCQIIHLGFYPLIAVIKNSQYRFKRVWDYHDFLLIFSFACSHIFLLAIFK